MSNYRYYQDVDGNQFESYEAACIYYGADTPDQADAEEALWNELQADMDTERAAEDPALLDPGFDEIPF